MQSNDYNRHKRAHDMIESEILRYRKLLKADFRSIDIFAVGSFDSNVGPSSSTSSINILCHSSLFSAKNNFCIKIPFSVLTFITICKYTGVNPNKPIFNVSSCVFFSQCFVVILSEHVSYVVIAVDDDITVYDVELIRKENAKNNWKEKIFSRL